MNSMPTQPHYPYTDAALYKWHYPTTFLVLPLYIECLPVV